MIHLLIRCICTPFPFCVYKNTKIQRRESALPFSASPYCYTSLFMPPDAPNHHLGYPISPFGVSHFTVWGIPFYHLGYPISPFGVSHFTIWSISFYHLRYPISPFGISHFTFWGIFSAHLRTMYSPVNGFAFFDFSLQNICVFFVNLKN